MPILDYSELSDKEIYDEIDTTIHAEEFLKSHFGKVMQEAANRIAEKSSRELALNVDPSNIAKVWEHKLIMRMYKYGFFDEIKQLAQEGPWLYDELTERRSGERDPEETTSGE